LQNNSYFFKYTFQLSIKQELKSEWLIGLL
jgi:hypothetical protein